MSNKFKPLFVLCNLDNGKLNVETPFASLSCPWAFVIFAIEEKDVVTIRMSLTPSVGEAYIETVSFKKEDRDKILKYIHMPQQLISAKEWSILVFDDKERTQDEFLEIYKKWEKSLNVATN